MGEGNVLFEPKQLEAAKRLAICGSIYQDIFVNDRCLKNSIQQ
jgi:hypothetical protein